MEKINFQNNITKANTETMNQFQDNIEKAINGMNNVDNDRLVPMYVIGYKTNLFN